MRNWRGTLFFRQQQQHQAATASDLQNLVEAAVLSAENLALAQNILTCRGGIKEEALEDSVDVEFGLVFQGKIGEVLSQDGKAAIIESQQIFISMENKGDTTIFISVFDVNAAGDISLISRSSPQGIELRPNKRHILGEVFGCLNGLKLAWPKKSSKSGI